jgi:hypothetical protein
LGFLAGLERNGKGKCKAFSLSRAHNFREDDTFNIELVLEDGHKVKFPTTNEIPGFCAKHGTSITILSLNCNVFSFEAAKLGEENTELWSPSARDDYILVKSADMVRKHAKVYFYWNSSDHPPVSGANVLGIMLGFTVHWRREYPVVMLVEQQDDYAERVGLWVVDMSEWHSPDEEGIMQKTEKEYERESS